jgi:hypothetical protein
MGKLIQQKMEILDTDDFHSATLINERTDGEYFYLLYKLNAMFIEKKYRRPYRDLVECITFNAGNKIIKLYDNFSPEA